MWWCMGWWEAGIGINWERRLRIERRTAATKAKENDTVIKNLRSRDRTG